MLTVPEVARRTGHHPETIRRWIRSGRLPARKVGTQHVVEEADLAALAQPDVLPLPDGWDRLPDGRPMPNWVALVRDGRRSH